MCTTLYNINIMVPTTIHIQGADITIRTYQPTDDIEYLTELLHRAYAGLAAMGFRYHATHQDSTVTAERLNGDLSFIAERNGIIVGTVTLYKTFPEDSCEWYTSNGVWHFGQFGIEPNLQRNGLGNAMMNIIELHAKQLGAQELACDTAEGATHLVNWYNKRGYRFIQHVQWGVTNYRSVVLSKTL